MNCPKSPRKLLGSAFIVAMGVAAVFGIRWWNDRHPELPMDLISQLPANCRQVVLVISPNASSASARLWRLERTDGGSWHAVSGSIPVTLGRNGLGEGLGEHRVMQTRDLPMKREGDGRSPAGIFRLPFAFGYDDSVSGLRMRYVRCTDTLAGVDDVKSKYYNQVVDAAAVTKDWDNAEVMRRQDGLYRLGAFVAHNPESAPGAGSCIFLHLWRGPEEPTAGCTAMSDENLQSLLAWLDPAAEPRLVQTAKAVSFPP